jgi:hypothetical protein
MQAPERASSRILWVWFAALALLVAGPLLGPGHLLLLDFPSGPHFPQMSFLPLPSSGDVGNAIPLTTLHVALRSIHPLLPEKLFLLAPILIGGLGAARFVRRRLGLETLPAAYAGTLFAVNPFVYDRLTAGQLYLLLAYALLPWAFSSLAEMLDRVDRRTVTAVALWLAVLAAVDLHVAGMFAMLVVIGALVGHRRRDFVAAASALGLFVLLSAYWLLPAAFTTPGPRIGLADLSVYATRPDGPAVLAHLLSLQGFWRDEFPGATQRIPLLALLLIPILAVAVVGARRLLSSERERRWTVTLAIGSVLALFLAAGISFPPTAGAFRWLFQHVPFMGVYREPQKWVAILALALAVFGGVGLERALEVVGRRRDPAHARTLRPVIGGLMVAATLGYSYTIFWGLWGQVSLSRYPDGWTAAEQVMERTGPGRLLVVPWDLYAVWSFTDGRIVANPAPSYFGREVVSADEAGFPEVPLQSPDPFSIYVGMILDHRDEVHAFGHLVAPLGVRYIALLREADWWQYAFLNRQGDLTEVHRGSGVVLFENDAWRGNLLSLSPPTTVEDPAKLPGSPEEAQVTSQLFRSSALAPRSDTGFPPIATPLPIWRDLQPSESPFVATADRCTDGWRLGERPAGCVLGAVSAFGSPAEPEQLWRPLAGAWLLGYVVSGLTLLGVLLCRRSGPQPQRSERGA